MKLLFASAEIYPYAKTGGLADVAQALPRALAKSIEVLSVMPLYDFIDRTHFGISSLDQFMWVKLGKNYYKIALYQGYNQGVETLFLYEPLLCCYQAPYGNEHGDYPNNDLRFGIFSKALVTLSQLYAVDLLHLNDWHTALAALWSREINPKLHTVFTIHNLAFQGIYPQTTMKILGLDSSYFKPDEIEYWGDINYMKAGIAYSDAVTTVSPRYAREILQPHFGCGLDGFLRVYQHKLYGILNGIDTLLFNPKSDLTITQNYHSGTLKYKKINKYTFCKKSGLEYAKRALFIFIGRFTGQKGVDIIIQTLPKLLNMELNIAILGEGDPTMAEKMLDIAREYPNLSVLFGYDESLSHNMYASADFLLMPSSFEPCGLNQLISLRYGTLPIVHRVGGLYDTIIDIDDLSSSICGRGIAIETLEPDSLTRAVERALILYKSSNDFTLKAQHNMHCDVSFDKSAEEYLDIYYSLD
ncbi:MAG: glycogen/starch synthase [Campylobacterota bacterium]|nr:glycogen/starch synthase [Campylobacterota bacterium]